MELLLGQAWAQEGGAGEAAPVAEGHAGEAHEGQAHEAGEEGEGHAVADYRLMSLQAINLGIFLLILFFVARRPVMDALGNRANAVRRDLDESLRVKDEADRRYHEIEARFAGLDRKIEDLKAEAAREAEAEAGRIRERAELDAVRIHDTAQRTLREEAIRARNEIRREVVDQATLLAREIVKQNVTVEDQARLQGELLGVLRTRTGGEA